MLLKIFREKEKPAFFSSLEVLRVSYCDSAVSLVHHASSTFACVRSRGQIFSPIIMKLGQNVCLDDISCYFENGSCWPKLGH